MASTRFLSRRTLALTVSLSAAALVSLSLVPGSGTANAAPSLAETERTLRDLGVKLDAINEQYNKANALLKLSRARQAELEARVAPYQARADVYQRKVSQIGVAAYTGGRTGILAAMLKGDSPQTLIDQMGVLDQISRDEQNTIAALKTARKPIEALHAKLQAEITVQAAQEKTLRDRKAALNKDMVKWRALATKLRPRSSRASRGGGQLPVYDGVASGRAEVVVKFAYANLGVPYVFGADGPANFDCSGYSLAAYAKIGVSLPHSAHLQYEQLPHVSRAAMKPGDLAFFYSDRHHVGIYLGNNKVAHAPQPGESTKISSMDVFPFNGAARFT